MPRISGVELVKKVRSAHMTLPIIMASGNLPAGDLDRAPWLRHVATLAKPFTGDELLGTVKKVLSESAITRNTALRCQSSAKEHSAPERTSFPAPAAFSPARSVI